MRYPPEFIERVLDNSNIVDLISAHTQLKQSGSQHMGLCPFPDHVEKSPSFSVSEAKQVYHCFGCQKSGNVFTFLQTYNGMSFPESVEYLARKANISLPTVSATQVDQEQQSRDKKQKIFKVNRMAADFYHQYLLAQPKSHSVWEYLKKRELNLEVINKFKIGLSPDEWGALSLHFEKNVVSMTLAEEAKLVKKNSQGGYFDMFINRLMFPIENAMGEVLGFGGRILNPEDKPKYLNSPESPVFHKSKVLYGLKEAAKFIRPAEHVIIVEGYMDCIALHKKGLVNCVATLGTALTPEHAKALSRITKNIVVLFDGDDAGQNAAERSLPILLAADLHPKGLVLPDELDPDEYLEQNSADSLRELVHQSPDLFNMVLSKWMKGYRGESFEKVNLIDKVKPVLGQMADLRLRSLYVQDLSIKLGVSLDWVRQSLNAKVSGSFQPLARPISPVTAPAPVPALPFDIKRTPELMSEAWVLSLCLKNRANMDEFNLSAGLQFLNQAWVKEIFEIILPHYRQHPDSFDKLTNLSASVIAEKGVEFQSDLNSLVFLAWDLKSEADELKVFKDAFKKTKIINLEIKIEALSQKLKLNPETADWQALTQMQKEKLKLSQNSL